MRNPVLIKTIFLVLAVALVAPTTHAPALTPHSSAAVPHTQVAPPTAGYSLVSGIVYTQPGHMPCSADFYLPRGSGPFPGIVFIHGGGWRAGNRQQLRRQAIYMARHGMVGMAIDYRLAPTDPFPAALHDARTAVAYLRSHATEYHVQPQHIAAVGSSAGAHLAAMLGVDPPSHPTAQASAVQAVVAFNGIYDFAAMAPSTMVSDFLGGSCASAAATCRQASPVDHIHTAPPFLVLHGTADKTAPYTQAVAFVDKLHAAHDPATLFTAPGAPHTFWAQKHWLPITQQLMCGFLRRNLAHGQRFTVSCAADPFAIPAQ